MVSEHREFYCFYRKENGIFAALRVLLYRNIVTWINSILLLQYSIIYLDYSGCSLSVHGYIPCVYTVVLKIICRLFLRLSVPVHVRSWTKYNIRSILRSIYTMITAVYRISTLWLLLRTHTCPNSTSYSYTALRSILRSVICILRKHIWEVYRIHIQ